MRQWFRVEFPNEVMTENVLQFTRSLSIRRRSGLLGTSTGVVFELVARQDEISWRLGLDDREREQVLGALRQALPALRLHPLEGRRIKATSAWELRTSTPLRPLHAGAPEQVVAALLAGLQDLHRSEEIVLSWICGPWLPRPPVPPPQRRSKDHDVLQLGELTLDSEQSRALRDKQKEPLYGVVGRIGVTASIDARSAVLRQRVLGALQLTRATGVGLQRRLIPSSFAIRRLRSLQQPIVQWPCILSASELVAVLGWPIGTPSVPTVAYSGGRVLPPVRGTYDRSGLRITGQATFPGRELPVGMPADPPTHSVTYGPTGTGKSVLLTQLVLQSAAGESVIVIDPSVKADLIRDIAERLPEWRLPDMVVIDARSQTPVGWNPLAGDPALATDAIVHSFAELFPSSFGPRTADVLLHGLLTLAQAGGYSLVELVPLLQHAAFRRHVLSRFGRSDQLGVASFWHRFEAYSDAERQQVVGPTQHRLQAFTSRPAVRAIIGQHPGFPLQDVFFKRRVVLVSLAPGEIGTEAATLLGSLLMGSLWAAAQTRSGLDPEQRFPVHLVADEFASFVRLPGDLGDALAQSRGLGVFWHLAAQHRSQLPPHLRQAIEANCRSKIVFQVGHEDATALAKLLGGGLDATDLTNLGRFETYQALAVGGHGSAPMSVRTLPLAGASHSYEAVKAVGETLHGMDRHDVDALLLERRRNEGNDKAPIGSRPRRPS